MNLEENPVYFSADFLKDKQFTFAKKGDVLVVRSGVNAGDVSVVEDDSNNAIVGADTLLCRCKDRVVPKFLQAYFYTDLGKRQIFRHTTGATNKHLNSENLRKVLVPQVPERIQSLAITIFEKGLAANRAKETEALEKIGVIDGVVLGALGIELPEGEDGTLKNRIFYTKSAAITASRIDPHFSLPYFLRFDQAVQSLPYRRLSELANFSSEIWDQESIFGEEFPYIEIGEIDLAMGEINETTNLVKAEAPSRAKMIARPNDMLISTTRPNRGAITLLGDDFDCRIASTGFVIIRTVTNEVSRKYLHHILRHRICLTQMDQRSSGGNYPAITIDELAKVKIPLPPPEVQAEIADKVDAIYREAKQLRREGDEILAAAKAEVERMILGE